MAYRPHEVGIEVITLPASARDVEVYFYGTGANPLLFLHGSGAHPTYYEPFFDAIAEIDGDVQIVAPCGPGTGRSAPLVNGESIIDWPVQVMEKTGMTDADERAVRISGHSRGGIEALHTATKFEDLQVLTHASPIGGISGDSMALLTVLSMDAVETGVRAIASEVMQGNPGKALKISSAAFSASIKFSLNLHPNVTDFREAADQIRRLPVEPRRALFESGRAQAIFGRRDRGVRPPKDKSWQGIHMTDGGHTFLLEGKPERRAQESLHLLYPDRH